MMRLIMDTNVVLQMFSARSPYKAILQAFLAGRFTWVVTLDVFLEYLEIAQQRGAPNTAFFLQRLLYQSKDIADTRVYYFFFALDADPDDNKFIDAYLAGQADYLVTWDKHFNAVKLSAFPKLDFGHYLLEENTDTVLS